MRLIAYARVSTDYQAEFGHSLPQQVDRLRDHAALLGHTVVDVVLDEGVSGSVELHKRPAGKQLLEALRTKRADGALVVRLDRLFRNTLDGLIFFDARHDARVVSTTENIDTSTPMGRFMLTQLLAMAQYERDMAAERAKDCNTALRKSGKAYGATPYAVVRVDLTTSSGDSSSLLFRDPVLWPLRCHVVALRRGGMSLRKVRDQLQRERVLSPAGNKTWTPASINSVTKTHDDLTHLPLAQHGASALRVVPEKGASHGHVH